MKNANKKMWESDSFVSEYKSKHGLLPAEQEIKRIISIIGNKNRMLDLGVGAGRTTDYFANLFNQYTGVDYSLNMIKACIEKYNYDFYVADVLTMPAFIKNFDFIFFSTQGISYFENFEDIRKCLQICMDLLNPGGIFAFSIQNSLSLEKHYRFNFPRNPFRIIPEFIRWRKIRTMNGPIDQYQGKLCYQITDGMISWQIHPEYMRGLLQDTGFKNIQIINEKGIVLGDAAKPTDFHIHFICTNN